MTALYLWARNRKQLIFFDKGCELLAVSPVPDMHPTSSSLYWSRVLLRDPCAYCGAASQAIDHVVPRRHGGQWHPDNTVGACRACNSSKGSRSLLYHLAVR
jgi:5-methylcytosine-specific restriction endonuclease McrA